MRAVSGNSRSKQIMAPTRTTPTAVSRSATGKPSPGVHDASGWSKAQVWTLAYVSTGAPWRSISVTLLRGAPGQASR